MGRGESVGREVEAEMECRNATGHDKAAGLLFDSSIFRQLTKNAVRCLASTSAHGRFESDMPASKQFIVRLVKIG